MDRFDPFVKYSDIYGDVINWEKDPMNKPHNQNKYFFSDGKTYYEQICKMLKLMSVFKDAFNQIYDNEDEISSAWENFVDNLSATAIYGEEAGVELTWTDTSVNFAFTIPGGEDGVGISSITFNSDYTMTITLTNGQTYTSTSLRGPQGEQGIQGAPGEPGPQGEPGAGLEILDVYPTLQDLQTAHPTGTPGDGYQVGTAPSFTLYIWSASQNQWVPAGTLGSVSPSLTPPLMDGTASAGSSDLYSRGDHVHPTDTSRASVSDLNDLSDVINESMILTDQEFTYRQSPAEHDGLANIDKIKGNTLIFNQLVQNGNFADTSVWQNYGSSFTVSGNTAIVKSTNASNQFGIYQSIMFKANHKYFISFEVKKYGTITLKRNRISSGQEQIQEGLYKTIETASADLTTSSALRILFGEPVSDINADYFTLKNYIIIDLTLMGFDSITSPDEFTKLFPLPYYAYNVGSLLSFNGIGIKNIGFNQWDEEWELGTINGSGELQPSTTEIRTKNYIQVLPNTSYYVATPGVQVFHYYAGDYSYLGSQYVGNSMALNIPSQTRYVKFRCANTYGTTYKNDICVNISDTSKNGAYEPYTENTIDLPTSTYFPTGMKSAGTVYDELTESKAITRIGVLNLGSISWDYTTNSSNIPIFVPSGNIPARAQGSNNLLCPLYTTIDASSRDGINGDKQLVRYNSSTATKIAISNFDYTDASAFRSAMAGVYLFYELATTTEQDIDIELTHFIYSGGTEQLLPINTSTPTTSPILCDMTYMSISDEILYLYNNSGTSPDIEDLENDVANIKTQIGSETTTPMTGILGRVNTLESSVTDLGSDVSDLETAIGSEATTPKTGILGRINALESDVSAIETEIGSEATTPMSGLAGRIKTIENTINNLKGKVVYEYTSTSNDQGLTNVQLDMSDLNNATHIEVIYSKVLNGNTTLSTGIIPYKFYDPSSVAIAGTIDDNQMDQNRERSWGISSSGALTINSCRTYYPDSPYEVTNSYLIIRQVILYKFTRASSLI